eukprot:CAMPEP_0175140534 /NCGR_PEP_ID=MMETSP0087-20121206/11573_1 /TAXON_ID=136419 /ORGANISM="Unknown Unknown, Strain D1" /LENGTH=308 /DNA_ID=CAMNT_0016423789 /DNA_START=12 /DNA_END=938 /DNA_ORIENTATION=-
MRFIFLVSAAVYASAKAVPTVTLNNKVQMPVVSAGTWQYNNSVAQQSCVDALAAGFTHFDTAHDYNNQEGVGAFFKDAVASKGRANLFLTSKVPGCGVPGQGVRGGAHCYNDTVSVFQENLKQLQVAFVDLMLIHFPPGGCNALTCGEIQSQWKAFEDMYAQNLSRAIGVSNYCQSCFSCLFKTAKTVPAVNQVQYHIGMGADPIGLHTYLTQKGIVMQAYSPLGDGSSELITGNLTNGIGKKYGKSGAQVALKWIVQHSVPLSTKSTKPKNLASDIDLFDFTLSASDMATLDAATSPAGKVSFMCTK